MALLAPLLLLGSVELLVRVMSPFPSLYGVQIEGEGARRAVTVESAFSSVQTRAELPTTGGDSCRLLFLGGSTTVGVPYAPVISYPEIVGERLRAMWSGRTIEVVNLGASTRSARVTRELALVAEDLELLDVDVAVIEAGHNEYLSHNLPGSFMAHSMRRLAESSWAFRSLARWWGAASESSAGSSAGSSADPDAVRAGARSSVWDAPELHQDDPAPRGTVEAWLAADLRDSIRAFRGLGVPVLVVLPPADWIDYGPEESRIPAGLDPEAIRRELSEIDRLLESVEFPGGGNDLAGEDLAGEDPAGEDPAGEAGRRLRSLLARAPELAAAEHRLAVLHHIRGEHDQVRPLLESAFDHAVRPHVVTPRTYDVMREVAEEEGAIVVDAGARFREASGPQAVGYPWIVDHCHPSLEGQYLLADAVLSAVLQSTGASDDPRLRPDLDPDLAQTMLRLGLARELRFAKAVHAGTADLRFALSSSSWRRYARRAILRLAEDAAEQTPAGGIAAVARGVAQLLIGDRDAGRASIERGLRLGGAEARNLLEALRASGPRVSRALDSAFGAAK